eukprot:jgi/Tetstr1/433050/TSEL_022385.t1
MLLRLLLRLEAFFPVPLPANVKTSIQIDNAAALDEVGGRAVVVAAEAVVRGHARAVSSVAWSPGSSRLATGSGDRTARVWEAAPGGRGGWRCVATLEGHADVVRSVAWSPDGHRLAIGSVDKTARLVVARHQRVAIPEEMWSYICECWSSDGWVVASPGEAAAMSGSAEVVLDSEGGDEGGQEAERPRVLVELEEAASASRECQVCLRESHATGKQDEGGYGPDGDVRSRRGGLYSVLARAVGEGKVELHFVTTPGVCDVTAAALSHVDAELGVQVVPDDEAAQLASLKSPSVVKLLARPADSKRPKRSRRQEVASLTVDSVDTLAQVKAKLWEALQPRTHS